MGRFKTVNYWLPHVFKSSGGIYVLLKQAKILQENGYIVRLFYQPKKHEKMDVYYKIKLDWVNFDISALNIIPVHHENIIFTDGTVHKANRLEIGINDVFLIPEGFPNIMKMLKDNPCRKIAYAQGASYIWRTLNVGESWCDYGVKEAITTSLEIEKHINLTMPSIKTYNYYFSINRKLFYPLEDMSQKTKTIVYLINRGQPQEMAANSIIKIFKLAYPQHNNWKFERLQGLSREEFAKHVRQATFALHLDDYVGLPIFPLEAMASHTHLVGWPGIGGDEHVVEGGGHWSPQHSLLPTAEMLNTAIQDYDAGKLNDRGVIYEKALEKFTEKQERASIIDIFQKLMKS